MYNKYGITSPHHPRRLFGAPVFPTVLCINISPRFCSFLCDTLISHSCYIHAHCIEEHSLWMSMCHTCHAFTQTKTHLRRLFGVLVFSAVLCVYIFHLGSALFSVTPSSAIHVIFMRIASGKTPGEHWWMCHMISQQPRCTFEQLQYHPVITHSFGAK